MIQATSQGLELSERGEKADPLLAILDERLRADLKTRVRRLLNDLAADDLPMALLDLAQLHRAIGAATPENVNRSRATLAATLLEFGEADRAREPAHLNSR